VDGHRASLRSARPLAEAFLSSVRGLHHHSGGGGDDAARRDSIDLGTAELQGGDEARIIPETGWSYDINHSRAYRARFGLESQVAPAYLRRMGAAALDRRPTAAFSSFYRRRVQAEQGVTVGRRAPGAAAPPPPPLLAVNSLYGRSAFATSHHRLPPGRGGGASAHRLPQGGGGRGGGGGERRGGATVAEPRPPSSGATARR
jgi:hypothetical protein